MSFSIFVNGNFKESKGFVFVFFFDMIYGHKKIINNVDDKRTCNCILDVILRNASYRFNSGC